MGAFLGCIVSIWLYWVISNVIKNTNGNNNNNIQKFIVPITIDYGISEPFVITNVQDKDIAYRALIRLEEDFIKKKKWDDEVARKKSDVCMSWQNYFNSDAFKTMDRKYATLQSRYDRLKTEMKTNNLI